MAYVRLVAVMSAALVASCHQRAAPADLSPADVAAIRATSTRWLDAMRQGHWEDAAATYTNDAVLRFPNAAYSGRAEILKSFRAMQPLKNFDLHIDEIHGRGDMAFVSGYSTLAVPGEAPVVAGRYLDIRLRQPDGTWLFYRDMVSPVPAAR